MNLTEFQQQIANTYGKKDQERGVAGTFMYFIEEVGELSEAIREPEKNDLAGEFADCLAWLTSLAHLCDIDLGKVTTEKYPAHCPVCHKSPCECDSKP